ncbi:MAG TPA: alpha-ketoglutarate-dependent dioxygenase AlkB [Usitatibacter sp.]|nr:alpha-ketoglutarate-dependent dioxygenase AlkB [Usitatibacter sp.]
MTASQGELFAAGSALPNGLVHRPDFITAAEERELLDGIATLDLREAAYKEYTARRRVASFGAGYDFDANELTPAPLIAPFLLPLRARVAAWVEMDPEAFGYALVSEYRPNTQLGWHRDVPQFELVAGVSLAGTARMRFRPFPPRRGVPILVLDLAPRSAYILRDEARWGWQHSIAPTPALRYSITFRTRRAT